MEELNQLYEQIGGVNTLFFDFLHNECVQDNENDYNEMSEQLDVLITKIESVRRILQIETENISRFNEIAEQIENLENEDSREALNNELYESLQIIMRSHFICRAGFEEYERRYNELTE